MQESSLKELIIDLIREGFSLRKIIGYAFPKKGEEVSKITDNPQMRKLARFAPLMAIGLLVLHLVLTIFWIEHVDAHSQTLHVLAGFIMGMHCITLVAILFYTIIIFGLALLVKLMKRSPALVLLFSPLPSIGAACVLSFFYFLYFLTLLA